MTTTRRILAIIGLGLVVTVGPAIPASATFADSAAVTTEISTGTVAAPSWAYAAVTYCHPVWSFDVTVYWPGSTTTRGVTGYRVTAHLNNGTSAVLTETGATARSYSTSIDRYYLQFQPQVTVSTLTSYGWTAESPRSAVITC